MICSVTDRGYVEYPYRDVRKFIPALSEWKVRKRSHCLSSAMSYTLSASLLAVRVFIYKGQENGEQVFLVDVEYKERGVTGMVKVDF